MLMFTSPQVAPKTVENFKKLANEGYFDGQAFHRIIPGFVIQGGDPNSKVRVRQFFWPSFTPQLTKRRKVLCRGAYELRPLAAP